MSIAPMTWNIQVSPSVKTFYSSPFLPPGIAYCSLSGNRVPLFNLKTMQNTNKTPKTLFKRISVQTNATVRLLQIFG